MKATFIGGGAHRLLPILRGALAQGNLFDGGEINLYDLDQTRAEALGRIVMKTPEFRRIRCKITWGTTLDQALDGADAVGVILMAGSALSNALSLRASWKRGFVPSDNLSANGAILGVKGVPIVMDIARRMESLCPEAWLMDFVNPIAVLSGAVNRHTRIKALGLCQGYTNHLSDIGRIFGKDAPLANLDVEAAGINHLSFIVRGTLNGKDLFPQLDRRVGKKWKLPALNSQWAPGTRKNIAASVTRLVDFYRRLGALIFSTEGDGMLHLDSEECFKKEFRSELIPTRSQIDAHLAEARGKRAKSNHRFAAHVNEELGASFWNSQPAGSVFGRMDDDIFVKVMKGIAGLETAKIVTSRINGTAIANLPADVVCEYSQYLYKQTIKPVATVRVPDVVLGMVSSLAIHQTMLADACATGDPKALAHALVAYPIRPYSRAAGNLFRELIAINRNEIPQSLRTADQYL